MNELPKGWVSVLAEDICEKVQSGSTPRNSPFTETGDVPYLKVYNIVNQKIAFNYKKQFISNEIHEGKLSRSIVFPNDVLMNIVGPPLGKVAIVGNDFPEWNINQAITLFRPNKSFLLSRFLYYFLNEGSSVKAVHGDLKGSVGQVNISLSQCRNFDIPVPPISEQKRIVEKLDEVLAQVDTIKARLDGIPDLLKRFRQSVLASAVSGKLTEEWRRESGNVESMKAYLELLNIQREDEYQVACQEAKTSGNRKPRKPPCIDPKVFANSEWVEEFVPLLPENWAVTCIGSIGQNNADSIVDGPFGASINVKNDYIESGTPVIRINNINPFSFDNDNLKFISQEKFSDLKRHNVEGGDLLLGKVGTIGNACIYPFGSEEAMLSTTGSTRIRVDTRVCLREYAELYLNSQKVAFNNIASAAVQPFLNMKTIKSFPFIAPPISEQKEIVRLVDQYFAFADTIEAQVKKAQARVDNLTQSILAKAFRGELVPQDPNDEPAEKLLERIAEARKEAEALAKAAKKAENAKKRAAKKAAENN
ncbi:restriction endonuclease subunit S [Vibrio parahaemolyticus]